MKKLIVCLLLVLMSTSAYALQEWTKASPAGSDNISDIDTKISTNNICVDRLLSNYRRGLTLSYTDSNTIAVAIGEVVCNNSAGTLRKFRQNTAALATNWSNIDTGAEGSDTYYVYAVGDDDTTACTVKWSLSSSVPGSTTYFKKLGSFINDGSSDITDSSITNDDNYYALAFGDWETKSNDTTYQADTDGFITTGLGGSAVRGYTGSVETDVDDEKDSVMRGRGTNNGSSASGKDGICMPVRSGDYYRVDGSTEVYWIPSE